MMAADNASSTFLDRKRFAWTAAFGGVAVIAVESTGGLGSAHTKALLLHVLNLVYAQADTERFEQVHHLLRKLGHLFGYGVLGILLARAWSTQIDRRMNIARLTRWSSLRLQGCSLGIVSAFLVACADELHQSFTPGRTASVGDVLIDTAGAMAFNIVALGMLTLKRPQGTLWVAKVRHHAGQWHVRLARMIAWERMQEETSD